MGLDCERGWFYAGGIFFIVVVEDAGVAGVRVYPGTSGFAPYVDSRGGGRVDRKILSGKAIRRIQVAAVCTGSTCRICVWNGINWDVGGGDCVDFKIGDAASVLGDTI